MQHNNYGDFVRELVVVSLASDDEINPVLDLLKQKDIYHQHVKWADYDIAAANSDGVPVVLLLGKNQLHKISRDLDIYQKPPFALLVSYDSGLLNFASILCLSHHYLIAPFDSNNIASQIEQINSSSSIDKQAMILMESNIIGESDALKGLLSVVANIARYDAPTLLKGETGTGKELVARSLHYCSLRCDEPFVPVNCGALSDELLLAELFGYEKGAFTDAKKSHAGYVQQANNGTLFLDEIDSLSMKAQAALLRFLQENEYRRLGSEQVHQANVRIICATNQDLADKVVNNLFREDLYYRLDVLDVEIPPLRDRENDIPILAEHFLQQFAKEYNEPVKYLHPKTVSWMQEYEWPGNVRELENYIYRIAILSQGQLISVPEIKGDPIRLFGGTSVANNQVKPRTFKEAKAAVVQRFERRFLQDVMRQAAGNVSEAARRAGTERRVFGRLLKKHGIERSQYCEG